MFNGNGFTAGTRVLSMAALRCAEVTLEHGYRYFVATEVVDTSSQASFTTPGYANTYGNAYAHGNAHVYGNSIYGNTTVTRNATTTFMPPQTRTINRPGLMVAIKMSNNKASLDPLGTFVNGQKVTPKDAAFLSNSLRQHIGKNKGA